MLRCVLPRGVPGTLAAAAAAAVTVSMWTASDSTSATPRRSFLHSTVHCADIVQRLPGADDALNRAVLQPPKSAQEVLELIRQYRPASTAPLHSLDAAAKVLQEHGEDVWADVIPELVLRASQFKHLFPDGVPFLPHGLRGHVSLTRDQVACLLANMVLCTFASASEDHAAHREATDMPFPVFSSMLTVRDRKEVHHKLACFLHFFARTPRELESNSGSVVFRRTLLPPPPTFDFWEESSKPLLMPHFKPGGIEDAGPGTLQVAFANTYLGGGVLRNGVVQEEILMALSPELTPALLMHPRLRDNEAACVTGAERFASYTGYSRSFRYAGDYVDETPVLRTPSRALNRSGAEAVYMDSGTLLRRVVSIDATHFPADSTFLEQVQPKVLLRELNKAYAGYGVDEPELTQADVPVVATGAWGCGVFNGDQSLKCLLQWLAASQGNRHMDYYPFGSKEILEQFKPFAEDIVRHNVTVGEMVQAVRFIVNRNPDMSSEEFLPALTEVLAKSHGSTS